jgi:tetrahydromethanopterin S-methyltransferase subunit F
MIQHATVEKTGRRIVPLVAGRLCAPVLIVILAMLATLAVF